MKFLVIADKTSPGLYDHFSKERFEGVEFVISCGDLPLDYMDFVVSMLNIPCFFVPGNHDEDFVKTPPPGWQNIDKKIVSYEEINILGFGGSMRYREGPNQYTEKEMKWNYLKLKPNIWFKKNRIDILAAHSPAFELGDLTDLPHTGFKVFRDIMDQYKPKYFVHGHVHLNYSNHSRILSYNKTTIINGFQHHIVDY